MRSFLFGFGCLLVAGATLASSLVLHEIQVDVAEGTAVEPGSEVVVLLQPADMVQDEIQRLTVEVPGVASVSLSPNPAAWTATVDGDSFWSAPTPIEESRTVLEVWPAQWIEATLPPGEDRNEPFREILAYITGSEVGERTFGPLKVPCSRNPPGLRCKVPHGRLDLRLEMTGKAPRYFWDLEPGEEQRLDVGTLRFQDGGSVCGWLTGQIDTSFQDLSLQLVPVASRPVGKGERKSQLRSQDAVVRADGRFRAEGIAPGLYELRLASESIFVSREQRLRVIEGESLDLGEIPLWRPARLDVQVDPPIAPTGGPWMVVLRQAQDPMAQLFRDVSQGDVDGAGLWSTTGLEPGLYGISLRDQDGSRWASEEIEVIAGESAYFPIQLDMTRVEGVVLLGSEEVDASIRFDHGRSSRPIEIESHDGDFSGYLPHAGDWDISVRPPDAEWLDLGSFEIDPSDGAARLRLEIPDTEQRVVVLDEEDAGVANATLIVRQETATGRRRVARSRTAEDGRARLIGLPEGEQWIEATGLDGSTSGWMSFFVSEDTEAPELELRVVKPLYLQGRVIHAGSPVAGAVVRVTVLGRSVSDPWAGQVRRVVTSLEGSFLVDLPAGRDVDVLVAAPGLPLLVRRWTFDSFPTEGSPMDVDLPLGAGDLSIQFSGLESGNPLPTVMLQRAGAMVSLDELLRLRRFEPRAEGALVLTGLGVGTWEVCNGRPGKPSVCQPVTINAGSISSVSID